jgi:N6-L-threonylcarbamoyladenine synthase
LVGVTFAKALASALRLPLAGVHHLEAHLYANALSGPLVFPALALVVSGGHTNLFYWSGHGALRLLGETRDDAAGEAFDKGARLLGLGYPGGPEIERLAATARPQARHALPIARLDPDALDFSFSGMKTRLARAVSEDPAHPAEWAWALQRAVGDALVQTVDRAWRRFPVPALYLAGGVAANGYVRGALEQWACAHAVRFSVPPPELCTDNGAMVAACGFYHLERGETMAWDDGPMTRWRLG